MTYSFWMFISFPFFINVYKAWREWEDNIRKDNWDVIWDILAKNMFKHNGIEMSLFLSNIAKGAQV